MKSIYKQVIMQIEKMKIWDSFCIAKVDWLIVKNEITSKLFCMILLHHKEK